MDEEKAMDPAEFGKLREDFRNSVLQELRERGISEADAMKAVTKLMGAFDQAHREEMQARNKKS